MSPTAKSLKKKEEGFKLIQKTFINEMNNI
jgi:hypothetical protein